MARPRKPTAVLELVGAFKHNPDRAAARANEPKPKKTVIKTGAPWMTLEQEKCYKEILRRAHPGVCMEPDTNHVQVVACLMAEFQAGPDDMPAPRVAALLAGLAKLGMNPSDRSRVQAPQTPGKTNPFDEFGKRAKAAA